MKKYKNFFGMQNSNKYQKILIMFLCIIVLNMVISFTTGVNLIQSGIRFLFDGNPTPSEEKKLVNYYSDDWNETNKVGGSYQITNSAEWTDINKAQIKLDLNTVVQSREKDRDIILVLDISGTMSGSRLNKAKEDSIALAQSILENPNNRIAVISFSDNATLNLNFTNNLTNVTNTINALVADGETNYTAALRSVGTLLSSSSQSTDKDVVTLFLTDGYPTTETPNQITEYAVLKKNYSNLTINGIQYELGSKIIDQIAEISDSQYSAYVDNLNDVLFEAASAGNPYEQFEVVKYIDDENFFVNSVDDIKVSRGSVKLEMENGKQKITWNLLSDGTEAVSFNTGGNASMTINATLKDNFIDKKGLFTTTEKVEVTSKLYDTDAKSKMFTETPILYNGYAILYDTNPPTGCSVRMTKTIESEIHSIYGTVTIRDDEPICEGYQFKGWKIDENDEIYITKISDTKFVMPARDVNIRAVWSKFEINKSMDGTIYERQDDNLIDLIKANNNWVIDTAVDFTDTTSAGTAGYYIRQGTENDENPIRYYRGAVTNNNVIFAGFCWKIVRTTETGGIKLIYNGSGASGTCNNSGTSTTIGNSRFATGYSNRNYLGYMYNNTSNSLAKTTIDNWYQNNLNSYTSYLENTVWCNDRTNSYSGGSYIYGAITTRNLDSNDSSTISPAVKDAEACPDVNDRFTTSSSSVGNKLLTYPIGLLTADEVTLAGLGWNGYSTSSYLNNGTYFWTMTPHIYNGDPNMFFASVEGLYSVATDYTSSMGDLPDIKIRPAISLKEDTLVEKGGDGSTSNPYKVKIG